jgi:hypothetical protein
MAIAYRVIMLPTSNAKNLRKTWNLQFLDDVFKKKIGYFEISVTAARVKQPWQRLL